MARDSSFPPPIVPTTGIEVEAVTTIFAPAFRGVDPEVPTTVTMAQGTPADRHEMRNLARNHEKREVLEWIHRHYDKVLSTWKTESVSTSSSVQYGAIFDRHLPWK